MYRKTFFFSFFIVLFPVFSLLLSCTPKNPYVRVVGSTPNEDTCYAKGVSGAYGGLLDGHLILAGGANFPQRPAADGGGKWYYEAIYATTNNICRRVSGLKDGGKTFKSDLTWQQVGVLPIPMAYGVTVSDSDGMVIVGGCNAAGGLSLAFRLSHRDGTLHMEQLPSLPFALDNMAGARLGDRIYVVGGLKDGQPSASMYALDFNYGEWFECAPLPNARLQPVCVAQDGKLYVWGGYVQPTDSLGRVLGENCVVYTDGYQYDPQADKWAPVSSPMTADGHPLTLSGGAAVAWGDKEILAVGGVNRNVFLGGIQGLFPMPDYLLHEPEWYRFNPNVLVFSTVTGQWRTLTQTTLTARAGASLISIPTETSMLGETSPVALLLGGELKPGIRSTDVTLISLKEEE